MSRARTSAGAAIACAALAMVVACGGGTGHRTSQAVTKPSASAANTPRRTPDGDWSTFDYDARRSGVGPGHTGISAADAPHLARRAVQVGGVVDSSAVQLHAVRVRGRVRDVVVVTTTYGRTIAFDPGTGRRLWEFAPRDIRSYIGSHQITTASPVLDPDRPYVYAASPDGVIHKLAVSSGRQAWGARITFDPTREKIGVALNLSARYVIAATGGYLGDAPTYEGHVALIDRSSGRVAHVFNAECSDRHQLIDPPRSCTADTTFGGSAIWARAGVVVEPGSSRLLVATGNGPFNGSTNWGNSVLELSSDASRLLHTYTPPNEAQLSASDTDLGSTAPALVGGGLAVQGGKDGLLRLLNLDRLAVGRNGGSLQTLAAPGSAEVFTAPAVWHHNGRAWLIVADEAGTAAYVLSGGRLHVAWQDGRAGTSPVLAGGLLYVYDQVDGALRILRPASGATVATLPAAGGHWSSPIVVGGRVILPVGGSPSDDASSGTVFVYHLPGR